MKRPNPKEAGPKIGCPACDGTGFQKVKQPVQPDRKIFPPPCRLCRGKGRIEIAAPLKQTRTGSLIKSVYRNELANHSSGVGHDYRLGRRSVRIRLCVYWRYLQV